MRASSVLLLLAAGAHAVDYEAMLDSLWKSSDKDGDDKLSLTEFKTACDTLGIEESTWTSHNKKHDDIFAALAGSDSLMTKKEMAGAITTTPEYEKPLIAAFTNGAGEVPKGVPAVSDAVSEAGAKVTMELTVSGKVSDIYPGTRKKITKWFADKCGVSVKEVIVTFLAAPAASERRLVEKVAPWRRKLSASTVVSGTAFVEDDDAAEAAVEALPSDTTGFQAEGAFSDLTVESVVPPDAVVSPELPISTAAIVGVILLAAGIAMCFIATTVSKSKASAAGAQGGCCKAGCCSFYAVKPWAFGEFASLVIFAGCLFYLFSNMSGVTETILGLIDTLASLLLSELPAIQDMTSALPRSILDQVIGFKSTVALLPFAVLGPGAVCLIALLVAALAPLHSGHKGSYCVTKCFVMLANVFLILSFVFYSIFVGIAVLLSSPPPVIQAQLKMITGMCDTIPPWIGQMLADNNAAVEQLKAAGQDTAELEEMLDSVSVLSTTIDDGCMYLTGFFEEFILLFLPGLLCIVAIVFALFVNNTLCCATGCCKGPPKAASTSAAESKSDATQQV